MMRSTNNRMDDIKNIVETLQTLIERGNEIKQKGEGCQPFVLVPEDHKILSLEAFLPIPSRKVGAPSFTHAKSFCEYVNQQKSEESRLYVVNPTQMVAVLNHHGKANAGWWDHRATFTLTKTPEWLTWNQNNTVNKTQRDFAQFIEDNSLDIEEPKGTELLDLVRTVKASQSLDVVGEIDEKNETVSGTFLVTARNKAGAKQEMELPGEFRILVAPYEGGERLSVRARLRLQLCAPKFMLRYELVRAQQIEKEALNQIVAGVTKEIDMVAWFGTP